MFLLTLKEINPGIIYLLGMMCSAYLYLVITSLHKLFQFFEKQHANLKVLESIGTTLPKDLNHSKIKRNLIVSCITAGFLLLVFPPVLEFLKKKITKICWK